MIVKKATVREPSGHKSEASVRRLLKTIPMFRLRRVDQMGAKMIHIVAGDQADLVDRMDPVKGMGFCQSELVFCPDSGWWFCLRHA